MYALVTSTLLCILAGCTSTETLIGTGVGAGLGNELCKGPCAFAMGFAGNVIGGVTHTVKSAAGVSEYTSSATKEWFPNVDAARAKYPHSPAIQGSDGRFYVVILNSENVTSTKTTLGYLPGGTPPPGK